MCARTGSSKLGNTKSSGGVVRKTVRAREMWVRMYAWETTGTETISKKKKKRKKINKMKTHPGAE